MWTALVPHYMVSDPRGSWSEYSLSWWNQVLAEVEFFITGNDCICSVWGIRFSWKLYAYMLWFFCHIALKQYLTQCLIDLCLLVEVKVIIWLPFVFTSQWAYWLTHTAQKTVPIIAREPASFEVFNVVNIILQSSRMWLYIVFLFFSHRFSPPFPL